MSPIEKIKATVEMFDPNRETIIVGGATITLALGSVGIDYDHELNDVDVLCPESFYNSSFSRLLDNEYLDRVSIHRPKQRQLEHGWETHGILELEPTSLACSRGAVSFTAHKNITDKYHSISYSLAKNIEVLYLGERSIPLYEVLRWIAIIGREKDICAVEAVLPVASSAGLISADQTKHVSEELAETKAYRSASPNRYYSRA